MAATKAATYKPEFTDWVRITYNRDESGLSTKDKAIRKRLETAINDALDLYHKEYSFTTGDIDEIELFPCDECEQEEAA